MTCRGPEALTSPRGREPDVSRRPDGLPPGPPPPVRSPRSGRVLRRACTGPPPQSGGLVALAQAYQPPGTAGPPGRALLICGTRRHRPQQCPRRGHTQAAGRRGPPRARGARQGSGALGTRSRDGGSNQTSPRGQEDEDTGRGDERRCRRRPVLCRGQSGRASRGSKRRLWWPERPAAERVQGSGPIRGPQQWEVGDAPRGALCRKGPKGAPGRGRQPGCRGPRWGGGASQLSAPCPRS